MRQIILLLLLICSVHLTSAQITFEKVIDTLGNVGAYCIKETFDGGYVFCGQSSYNGNDATIVKLDSTGMIEWVKVYSGPGLEGATFIELTPDSGYMVNSIYNTGPNAQTWLLRLDSNGDTLLTSTFKAGMGSTETASGNSMASLNDSIYGLCGYFDPFPFTNTCSYFIASKNDGSFVNSKIYNPSQFGSDLRCISSANNGFIMAGAIGTSNFTSDIYVIKSDSNGDTIWTKNYDYSQVDAAFSIVQTNDSAFVASGMYYNNAAYNMFIMKIDSSGDSVWTKLYYNSLSESIRSIQQTKDDGFILCGSKQDNINFDYDIYLVKTNAFGDTLWTRTFGSNASDNGYFARQTKDGGYLICGDGVVNGSFGSYIIKTDSLGNVSTSTGIPEVNNPFEFFVYPNPTSGIISIKPKGISSTNSIIEIYNVNGQCIYHCKIKNNTIEQIDLSNHPNGIYMITLRSDKLYSSRKILLQK